MAQRKLSSMLVKQAYPPTASSTASDVITTICDMGDCQNVTAIVNFDFSTDTISDLRFWTSSSDTSGATGTRQTATTNTVQVNVVSDNDSLTAWNGNTRVTSLVVSHGGIKTLATQDMAIAVELPNTRRYLYAQWGAGGGTGSELAITFIGHDPSGSDRPWTAARTGY